MQGAFAVMVVLIFVLAILMLSCSFPPIATDRGQVGTNIAATNDAVEAVISTAVSASLTAVYSEQTTATAQAGQ